MRKEREKLHDMVEYHNETKMTLQKCTDSGELIEEEVWAKELVPGDVIIIPPAGVILACDAVLTSGNLFIPSLCCLILVSWQKPIPIFIKKSVFEITSSFLNICMASF